MRHLMKKFLQKISLTILSVLIVLILIEFGLRMGGNFLSFQRQLKHHVSDSEDRAKILCIGDSHTWGYGSSSEASYPSQLENIINSTRREKYQVINAGIPGMNSAMIAEELVKKVNAYAPVAVIINGGSNNGWNRSSLSKHGDVNNKPVLWGWKSVENIFEVIYELRIYKLVNAVITQVHQPRYSFKPELFLPNHVKDKHGNDFADTVIVRDGSIREVLKYEGHPDSPIPWGNKNESYEEHFKKYLGACYMEMIQFLRYRKIPFIFETYLCDYEGGYHLANVAIRESGDKYNVPVVKNDTYIKTHNYENTDFLIPDGHPNEKGYRVMAENTYKVLGGILDQIEGSKSACS